MEEAKINININPGFLSLLANSKTKYSIDEKINLSLAIFLFTERAITLARASELAGLGLGDFINVLSNHNIFWSEYTPEHKEQDDLTIKYILKEESNND
jgi:predicted HTH domain antitoxin